MKKTKQREVDFDNFTTKNSMFEYSIRSDRYGFQNIIYLKEVPIPHFLSERDTRINSIVTTTSFACLPLVLSKIICDYDFNFTRAITNINSNSKQNFGTGSILKIHKINCEGESMNIDADDDDNLNANLEIDSSKPENDNNDNNDNDNIRRILPTTFINYQNGKIQLKDDLLLLITMDDPMQFFTCQYDSKNFILHLFITRNSPNTSFGQEHIRINVKTRQLVSHNNIDSYLSNIIHSSNLFYEIKFIINNSRLYMCTFPFELQEHQGSLHLFNYDRNNDNYLDCHNDTAYASMWMEIYSNIPLGTNIIPIDSQESLLIIFPNGKCHLFDLKTHKIGNPLEFLQIPETFDKFSPQFQKDQHRQFKLKLGIDKDKSNYLLFKDEEKLYFKISYVLKTRLIHQTFSLCLYVHLPLDASSRWIEWKRTFNMDTGMDFPDHLNMPIGEEDYLILSTSSSSQISH